MAKLYTCFECKGDVIERNGIEFCSDCGTKFTKSNNDIVQVIEVKDNDVPQTEVMSEDDKLIDDMMNIINEGAEERIEVRKNLTGFDRVEFDVENAGKIIYNLLTKDY